MTPEQKARQYASQRRWLERNRDGQREYQAAWRRQARAEGRPIAEADRERKRSDPYRAMALDAKAQPGQQAMAREYMRDYRKRPDAAAKNRARSAVNTAITSGRLTRPDSCQICGSTPGRGRDGRSLIRADHWHGYDREHYLDVQWICTSCDGTLERARKAHIATVEANESTPTGG